MTESLAVAGHFNTPSFVRVETCTTRSTMSQPKTVKKLTDVLRDEYRGPHAAKPFARDVGCKESAAKMALNGQYPKSWERFLALIAKKPAILARALETTWAEELAVKAEIVATRRRLDEMERRLSEKNQTLDRTKT